MTKAPWEGEKAPAATTPAPQPDPVNSTVTATPTDPAITPTDPTITPPPPPPPANVTEPVAEVADAEALAAFTPSIDGPQAPLELINLVSNGMSVSEAKKHLGME